MSETRILSSAPGAVWVAGVMLSLLTAAAAPRLSAQQSQRYEVAGADVAIYNLAGTVRIERGSGSAVVVELTRQGRDGDQLRVETGPIADRATLRVVYPGDDIVYRAARGSWDTELRVREDGTFGDAHWHDRGHRGGRVRISSRGSGLEAAADLRILVPPSQRLAVYLAAGDVSARNVNGTLRIDTHHANVSTSGTSGALVVDTGSGSVEVSDAEGDVLVDTGSGSVDVTGVKGDALLVDTGSGSVTLTDVAVSNMNLDTGSGRVDVSRSSARDVLLDTGSGAVNIEIMNDAERIVVDTGSGAVTVTVPSTFSAQLEIDTGSGGIDIDFPLQVTKWERTHVVGTIGDGAGQLRIDTGSGSVRIRRGG